MRRAVALLAGLIVVASSSQAWAKVSGQLDQSFGTHGKVLTDFSGGEDVARAIAIQSDGKIVAAGFSSVARYNPDGTLDTTFGAGGKVLTCCVLVTALAIQSDGRIVAAGVSFDISEDFGLARYNSDGTLDTTFGAGGTVLTDFSGTGSDDSAFALAIQSDGKIVAAGRSIAANATKGDFAVARYNSDGTLDTTFGAGGTVLTDFSSTGSDDVATAVAIQSDGRIVASGIKVGSRAAKFALARYNPDGTLDSTFGTGGKVLTRFPDNADYAFAMAIQSDGKIVAAGLNQSGDGRQDFALARYDSDGALDKTFGTGGKVLTDLGGSEELANALAIQSDGKIVAAGLSNAATGTLAFDFALARYNSNGTLDPTFGSGGKVLTDFTGTGSEDIANALAIQSDGKIVAAGFSDANVDGGHSDFALARYRP